jgi:hypothetical protein
MTQPLTHRIVGYLRATRGAISHEGLAYRLNATDPDDIATALAELCASGPLVAIDHGGDCWYALEWGVPAPWETGP